MFKYQQTYFLTNKCEQVTNPNDLNTTIIIHLDMQMTYYFLRNIFILTSCINPSKKKIGHHIWQKENYKRIFASINKDGGQLCFF